ncbi:MAG: flippase [Thermomicrobiales bacterium]|nr:flippase [Thermomicrobiales bacterium]
MFVIKDSTFTFGSRLVASAATLCVGVILARQFGSDAQGQYAVMLASVLFLQLFADLGLTYSNVLHIGQRTIDESDVVAVSIYAGASIALVLVGAVVAAMPLLRHSVFDDTPDAIILIGLCSLPPIVLGSTLNAVNLGRQHMHRFNLINLVHGTSNLALVVLFVFGFNWSMRAVASAWLIASLIFLIATAVCAFRGIDRRRALSPRRARAAAPLLLRYGAKSQVGNIAQFMNNRFDQLLVSAWLGSSQLGFYVAAVSFGEAFRFLPNAINTVLLSRVAASSEQDGRLLTGRAFKLTAAFALVWAAVSLVACVVFIRVLYGAAYEQAVGPTRILIPGIALLMTSSVFGAYLAGRGRAMVNSWITFAGLAVTLVLDVLLIPAWGIEGAAVASLASYTTCAVLTFSAYWKLAIAPGRSGSMPLRAEARTS